MKLPPWLTWGRAIGFAIFGLCLISSQTRLLALAYGAGWLLVEWFKAVFREKKYWKDR